MIKDLRGIILLLAGFFATGCASFPSGEIKIDKNLAVEMLGDTNFEKYADVKISWVNYPYRTSSSKIGDGVKFDEKGNIKPVEIRPIPVEAKDKDKLLSMAKKIFTKAGIINRNTGKGTINLKLKTSGKWTYAEIVNSFLVETPFVILFPRFLPVGYALESEFNTSTGTAKVELNATNKTMFFLLAAPLYPFKSPSSGEKTLLNQILWRMATEIYDSVKKADIQAALLPKQPEVTPEVKQEDTVTNQDNNQELQGETNIVEPVTGIVTDTNNTETNDNQLIDNEEDISNTEEDINPDFEPTVVMPTDVE